MKAKTTNYYMVAKKRRKTKKKKLGAWSLHTFFCSFEILKLHDKKKMGFSLINCFFFHVECYLYHFLIYFTLFTENSSHKRSYEHFSLLKTLFFNMSCCGCFYYHSFFYFMFFYFTFSEAHRGQTTSMINVD